MYDGSVCGGCEVVSPPMSGPAAFEQIATVVEALRAAGATINTSCGLHVHHEVIDLTGEELARLVECYSENQTTMDSLVAPSRRGAGYARHFRAGEVADLASRLRCAATAGRDAQTAVRQQGIGGRPDSRYRVLNVHCFPTYGTVEFRQHQGTLNAAKIAAWVRLGQAMIEAVRSTVAVDTDAMLASLVAADVLDAETSTYLNDRAAALVA